MVKNIFLIVRTLVAYPNLRRQNEGSKREQASLEPCQILTCYACVSVYILQLYQ